MVGRRVELVFSPFNLEVIEVRHGGRSYGRAVPHQITRHTHPKARPETPEPAPPPATGIDYLKLIADDHQQQMLDDELIGFRALYSTTPHTDPDTPATPEADPDQIPGQLSLDDHTDQIAAEAPEPEDQA